MADLKKLSEALERADVDRVKKLTAEAPAEGLSPKDILKNGLIEGMDVVGVKCRSGEMFLPEVLVAAKAMHGGLEVLRPKLVETGVKPAGKMVLGTVKGDLHDIGKNMVGMMPQGAGFEVIDIGVDCPPREVR